MTIRIRGRLWGGPPGPRPAPRPASAAVESPTPSAAALSDPRVQLAGESACPTKTGAFAYQRGTDAFVCQPGDGSPDRLSTHALRRSRSFCLSLCIHGAVVALLALSSATQSAAPRPLYDQEIRPYEHKLIWYSLKNRTPDVRPTLEKTPPRPPRATRKFDQSLIAGVKEDARPPQKVWIPDAPKVDLTKVKVEPLPNLLAIAPAPQRPLRAFQPPPEPQAKPKPAPVILEAPEAALKPAAAIPTDFSLETKLPRPLRTFVPPPSVKAVKNTATELPLPPETPMAAAPLTTASMAIVGLDPAKTMEIPKPPPPREANFSAGPKLNPDGESAPASTAMLSVPSLYVHGGPKDIRPSLTAGLAPASRQNLMEAMRMGNIAAPLAPPPHAPRVSSSPDPRMDGRLVYMMAIQMQNITSYSGSWMVWFAEHQPLLGAPPLEMRPPDPLHKVDPKYIADAVLERVEGVVRLSAVIRKSGRVESVELLKHLDDRLDKSAAEALGKWQFQPALRDGAPVDVDAVFEIPFRLAPRIAK
jgi:TonB family protein